MTAQLRVRAVWGVLQEAAGVVTAAYGLAQVLWGAFCRSWVFKTWRE